MCGIDRENEYYHVLLSLNKQTLKRNVLFVAASRYFIKSVKLIPPCRTRALKRSSFDDPLSSGGHCRVGISMNSEVKSQLHSSAMIFATSSLRISADSSVSPA